MLNLAKSFRVCNAGSSVLKSSVELQRRLLNLHEYQSYQIMKDYGVEVPRFQAAFTPREAMSAAESLGETDYVIKAQVLAGGRGLGRFKENNFQGGVHICTSAEKVKEIAQKMLGQTLVTKQTGEQGKPCNAVMIAERFYIRNEKYFAILMDRAYGGAVMIGSSVGGMNIEDIAEKHPDKIIRMPVSMKDGLSHEKALEFAKQLDFGEKQVEQAAKNIEGLFEMFLKSDCTLVEVNPFAETSDGRVIVCDAKVNFDDNAAFRQKDIHNLRDITQEDPREVAASHYDLNYVGLDGNIGCMVNGAGLAMATMDIIKLKGGKPANFLDVGGGASKNQVVEAFRILQNDPNVKAILINIFGGIMRCDTIALGILAATQELGLTKPLIVRLEGTNQEQARQLIEESGLRMCFCEDLDLAAQKAVKMVEIIQLANTAGINVGFEF